VPRLLTGVFVGGIGGFIISLSVGNGPEPISIAAFGGLIGGAIALGVGLLDWIAGPPPKSK
jgi:hypothetical protein